MRAASRFARSASYKLNRIALSPVLAVAVDHLNECLGSQAPEFLQVHIDAGQLWPCTFDEDVPVVKSDDCHVAGNSAAGFPDSIHDASCNVVTPGDDGVNLGVSVKQSRRCLPSPHFVPHPEHETGISDKFKSVITERCDGTPQSIAGGSVALLAVHDRDASSPSRREVVHRHVARQLVVRFEREVLFISRWRVDVNDWYLWLGLERRPRVGRPADNQHSVDTSSKQRLELKLLAERAVTSIG